MKWFFLLVSCWFCFDSPEAGKRVSHRVYVVYAGMEPMTFKALFPYWNDTPDVIRIQKMVCTLHLIGGTVRIVKNNWSRSSCHVWETYVMSTLISLVHSATRTLGHSVTRSLGHSVTRSLGNSVTCSLGHSFIRSLVRRCARIPTRGEDSNSPGVTS